MDKLISNAIFLHDDENKHSEYDGKVDQWRDDSGSVKSSQIFSAIDTLKKKLIQGKCPTFDTEGWKQAATSTFNNLICSFVSDLIDDGKLKVNDVRETYFKLYLEWFHYGPATVHLEIMKETFHNSDVNMEEYLKSLTGKPRAKLIKAITSPIVKKEDTEDTVFYEEHRSYMDRFIHDAFESSSLLEKGMMKIWLEYSFHLYLDYLHLDDESLDHVCREADDRFDEINDGWEDFSDVESLKSAIKMITASIKMPGFPRNKEVADAVLRPISKLWRKLRKPGDAETYSDVMFDLLETVSTCEGDFEHLLCVFNEVLKFFVEQKTNVIKKRVAYFKAVAPRYATLLEKLDMKFLKNSRYASWMMDKLEVSYAHDKTLVKDWVGLIVPALKCPCYECLQAAHSVLSGDDAIRWKDHKDEAHKVFECLRHIQIPTGNIEDDKRYIKAYASCINDFLGGLKKARILKEFGDGLMFLGINLLELEQVDEQIFELIEEIGENIEINVKENKDKVMEVMKRIHVVLKNESLPWTECWPLQRAIEDTINSIIEPVKDGHVFTDDDLKVFTLMCSTCLNKDALNPSDATLSAHFAIANAILENLLQWMTTTKRLGYAVKLIPLILSKYDDDEERVTASCNIHLNGFAIGEAATMAPHLEQLIKIYLDKKDFNILPVINIVYPVNPAPMNEYFQTMLSQLIDSGKSQDKTRMTEIFWTASKKQPELFTDNNMKDIIETAKNDVDNQAMLIQIMQEISKRKPERMVKHIDMIMDRNGWNPITYSWLSDVLSTLALYDESQATKVMNYQMKSVITNQDKGVMLTSLNSIRMIEFKYPDIIKPKRQEIANLQITDGDGQMMKQTILDMIDGNTPDDLRKQMEEQQGALSDLKDQVEEAEVAVIAVRDDLDEQGQKLDNVTNEVNQQGQRLDQVEETVEETVAKVEEIDSKTLSHAPYWSRDISKLLNPATEHDWRLLSSHLGYSHADIRGWAQQADPCMAMLNEWYATRKTSEATFAVLTNLQEMNRMDAALIVENAMKKAEAVVEDDEFEYASPPSIFISYQWGHQEEVKLLHRHLTMAGYDCWLDIGQMGGGDKLFEKIDNGMRAAKLVISCVTTKYAKSPNCNREVTLAVGVNKPIIPLLLENSTWPPPGSMGPIFSESLYIQFFQTGKEETPDERYWPVDKFQELLMQLSVNGLTPDEGKIEPMYRNWWLPLEKEIKIDKSKTRDGGKKVETVQSEANNELGENPEVFISYQWGKQKNIIQLYKRLTSLGFSCWLDIKQMGGGDSLYDKIDRGVRGCKVVLSCVTKKYALSANCRREVSLTDALKKPMLPLLLEEMTWPPSGPMSMVMTQLLYIDFQQESAHTTWNVPQFEELVNKIKQHLPRPLKESTKNEKMEKQTAPAEKKSTVDEQKTPKVEKNADPVVGKPESVKKSNPPSTSDLTHNNNERDNQTSNKPQEHPKPQTSASSPSPSSAPSSNPPKSKSCSVL